MAEPLEVAPQDERQYRADLLEWRLMCASYGPESALTWRDEQSFKRAWCVQQARLDVREEN